MTATDETTATAHPDKWNQVEKKFWGTGHDPSRPVPEELLHVSVYHSGPGVDELVRFYQTVLNLRVTFTAQYGTWEFIALSHDDENHRLGIVNAFASKTAFDGSDNVAADVPAGTTARESVQRPCRLEHTNWRYRDVASLMDVMKHTHETLGIWPRTTRISPGDFTIDYIDPDGNRLEMLSQFSPTKASVLWGMWNGQAHLREAEAAGNPVIQEFGKFYLDVDPQKLLALWESGVAEDQLVRRGPADALKAQGKL